MVVLVTRAALSEGVKESDERIGRFVSAWPAVRAGWCCASDRLFFQFQIGVEVDLGRLDAFMSEPERDRRDIDAGLEQVHRAGMAKNVWSELFRLQRRASLLRGEAVTGDETSDSVAAERLVRWPGEHDGGGLVGDFSQPLAQHLHRVSGQWCAAVLAAFAKTPHERCGLQFDVATSDRGDFRNAEPGLDGHGEQSVIASTDPVVAVRGCEERVGLVVGEVGHVGAFPTFLRDIEDSLDQRGVFGVT